MDEAGQPLGRASPDDESGLERRFSVPSAVGGNRCADAVNHSFIASVQASQWGGVAYSPAIRPRPLGPRQGGAFQRCRRAEAAQELVSPYCRELLLEPARYWTASIEHDPRELPLPVELFC